MATGVTSRITATPAQQLTRRVVPTGELVVDGYTIDRWGGTWGNAWGNTWYGVSSSFQSGAIGGSSEARVTGVIAQNITKRI